MKKLLYIILLLPLWVNAQTNGTIQKTSATGTIRGSFGSLGLDTLTRVTGALVDGYILKYHAATNKWYASPDGYIAGLQDSLTKKANRTFDNVASGAIAKSKVDTTATGLQTVSNFFPKGDTRYQRSSVAPTSISATSPIFYNSGTGVISSQAASATVEGYVTTGTQTFAGNKTFNGSVSGTSSVWSDLMQITRGDANSLLVSNTSATNAPIISSNTGAGYLHGFFNNSGGVSYINNSGLLEKVGGTDAQFLRANGTVLGSTGSGDVVRATSPTLTTPNIGNATGGTLSLSGLLTSTQGNNTQIFNSATATTGYQFGRMTNTSGALLWGIEGSAAGTLLTGGSAYGGFLTTGTSTNLELGTDQTIGIKIDGSNRKITMPELGGAGDVIIGANNTGLLGEIAIGSGLSLSGGVLTATGGSSGSVTTSGGTAGKITKFTSASNVENSIMTESSGLIDVTGDLTANIVTADVGHKYNFGAANRGGIYGYSTLSGSGTDYTPTYYSESGLGANFYVDGGLTKGFTIATTGDATFSGSISSPDDIPFVLSSPTSIDFHQSGGGTVRFVNDAFSSVNMSLNNSGDMDVRGALSVTGAISGSNLSGTNTGDQNLAPYATLASPALTGNPTAPTQTAGDNSTKIATTAYVDRLGGGTVTSGTYTPTLTNELNVTSSGAGKCFYKRIGNIVFVQGYINVTTTTGTSTATALGISLPIASNFDSTDDSSGTSNGQGDSYAKAGLIEADPTNDRAKISYYAVTNTLGGIFFSFSYEIL